MNNQRTATEPDWALLRVFLEVAGTGSLSRAALALGSSQPTLSRRLAQLEAQLGHALFERTTRGVR
ncbi:MAG: LysR family transcriptional regulator, partial [Burkholderiales bacterium]